MFEDHQIKMVHMKDRKLCNGEESVILNGKQIYFKEEKKMEKTHKKQKEIILSLALLAAVILVLLLVYQFTKKEAVEGQKTVTIRVIHMDRSENSFEVTTTEEYLGAILREEEIAEGEDGPYGMYIISADGEIADETNQEWWCITENGEQVNTSADKTPVMDGDEYELTLMAGY